MPDAAASPPATASAPPSVKSFCTSTMRSALLMLMRVPVTVDPGTLHPPPPPAHLTCPAGLLRWRGEPDALAALPCARIRPIGVVKPRRRCATTVPRRVQRLLLLRPRANAEVVRACARHLAGGGDC